MTDLSPSHSRRLPWTIGAGLFLCYSALECVGLLTSGEATTAYFIRYLIAYAMLCALWYLSSQKKTAGQSFLALIWPLLIFPFGVLLSSTVLLCRVLFPPPDEGRGEVGEEDTHFFKVRSNLLSKPFEEGQKELFLPAISLLESGGIDERRAAIDVLAKIGGPEQIRHLQACLDDPEREVYQFAHAKLTGLHEGYTDAIKSAQEMNSREQLLDQYVDYINSGLLGEATSAFYRQKAIGVALQLSQEHPKNVALLNLLAKLHFEQGEKVEAQLLLERSLQIDSESLEARWQLAKMAYEHRDFESLKSHLVNLGKLSLGDATEQNEITRSVGWWLETDRD